MCNSKSEVKDGNTTKIIELEFCCNCKLIFTSQMLVSRFVYHVTFYYCIPAS